ncbi:MAG: VOC family protein [Amphiplicatus sp.]
MEKIAPCLWFDSEAEDAATFYCAVFPNSKISAVSRYGKEGFEHHRKPEGSVLTVEFELNGDPFLALNGGPVFKISEAVSFVVPCKDQKEVDYYWRKLTADGGAENACGWLKDKFGVSWQIVPEAFFRMIKDPDKKKTGRVMQAMFTMTKFDIAALEKAYAG